MYLRKSNNSSGKVSNTLGKLPAQWLLDQNLVRSDMPAFVPIMDLLQRTPTPSEVLGILLRSIKNEP